MPVLGSPNPLQPPPRGGYASTPASGQDGPHGEVDKDSLRWRGAALLLPAVMAAAAGLSAQSPGAAAVPARRAALGTLTITPTSGTVGGNPMLVSAITSAPCPARYGSAALLRVGPVGGPYSNIARPGGAGSYDTAPVSMHPNRSMATSQGRPPGDGEYVIVVECVSDTLGTHPDRFEARIVVSGDTWRVRSGTGGRATPTASAAPETTTGPPSGPSPGATPTAPSAPTGAAGKPTITATPDGTSADLASRPDEGGSPLPWALGGVALLACAAAVPLIRRRGSRQP
ncbi:hypothetical protein [Plantactinospora sp. KLBMP9567]|uniref:hypothetical protein n=1 Tax=Plantactinospora sp. KLBMP9567 TaxID=3085900 RepID=UPI002980E1B2|nr:hypothetical protein [Plantactinospora sp. KLBMP9567]MDW5322229.1 hypothetical protein [Plantactinospora sp. KLBMP9567]MDW5324457.1 hypothetical protein [Plantactinospora sp. KLBMP9567]